MKKLLTMLVLALGIFSFTLADDCDTIVSRMNSLEEQMYSIQANADRVYAQMQSYNVQINRPLYHSYETQLQNYTNQLQNIGFQFNDLQVEAVRCRNAEAERIEQEKVISAELSSHINQGDYYLSRGDTKSALSEFKEAYDLSLKLSNNDNQRRALEETVDEISLVLDLTDREQRAYEYMQNKEIDRAYNLYKDIVSYENKSKSYIFTTAKAALKDLEKIKELQKEMDEAEKAQKKAEEKAKADAEQKAYMEQVERAKKELGNKAPIVESFPSAPKLQDKTIRANVLKLCNGWKNSKNNYHKSFGIYLEYLLNKDS